MESESFECAHCNYICRKKFNIKRHIQKQHGHGEKERKTNITSSKSAQCSTCGKLFVNKFNLDRHMKMIHNVQNGDNGSKYKKNEKLFRCNECFASFGSRTSVYRHRIAKHGKTPIRKKSALAPAPKNLCSYSNDLTDDDMVNRRNILVTFPDNYVYNIVKFKSDGEVPFLLECEFRIFNISEVEKWKANYEQMNKVFFRKNKVRKSIKKSVVYKEKFHCGHFMVHTKKSRCNSERQTNCPFRLQLRVTKHENCLITRVKLVGTHNHLTNCAASTKFRPVSEEVRSKFLSLFHQGYTPAKAFRIHLQDLKEKYNDEFHKIQDDRYYCPNKKWVFRLHNAISKIQSGAAYGKETLNKLMEEVEKCEYAKLKIIDERCNYVLSIVTPFMQRVHTEISQSSEVTFIDSTGTVDRLGCKIFVLLTNSTTGGLPLGLIITTMETENAIITGMRLLKELLPKNAFGGRGMRGPCLFMTDNCSAERTALSNVFPEATLLLSQLHILQAMWRYIWKNDTGIRNCDRRTLFCIFKSLVFEKDEENFYKKVEVAFQNELVKQYSNFSNHLKGILKLKNYWATYFRIRNTLILCGKDTNICEASMRIIKEVILNRAKACSPVHLFTVLISEFEEYFKDKLTSVCDGRVATYLQTRLRKLNRKLVGMKYDKIIGKVHNLKENYYYEVDMDIGMCSCIDGSNGKLCEHLLVALKTSEVEHDIMMPETESDKKKLLFIAFGEEIPKDDWFRPLQETTLECSPVQCYTDTFCTEVSNEEWELLAEALIDDVSYDELSDDEQMTEDELFSSFNRMITL